MASAIYEEILAKALQQNPGVKRVKGDLLLKTAMEQKAMDLTNTIALRRADGAEISENDLKAAEDSAEQYVDALIDDMVRMDLDSLIKYNKRKSSRTKAPGEPVRSLRRRTGQFIKAADLQSLLNVVLYRYAQQFMGSPRLNNRTGRLAHSGVVTSIVNADKPKVSLYFRYMTAPYSVFEPGGKMGSNVRSPKNLFKDAIDAALSDILNPASKDRINIAWRR